VEVLCVKSTKCCYGCSNCDIVNVSVELDRWFLGPQGEPTHNQDGEGAKTSSSQEMLHSYLK